MEYKRCLYIRGSDAYSMTYSDLSMGDAREEELGSFHELDQANFVLCIPIRFKHTTQYCQSVHSGCLLDRWPRIGVRQLEAYCISVER